MWFSHSILGKQGKSGYESVIFPAPKRNQLRCPWTGLHKKFYICDKTVLGHHKPQFNISVFCKDCCNWRSSCLLKINQFLRDRHVLLKFVVATIQKAKICARGMKSIFSDFIKIFSWCSHSNGLFLLTACWIFYLVEGSARDCKINQNKSK